MQAVAFNPHRRQPIAKSFVVELIVGGKELEIDRLRDESEARALVNILTGGVSKTLRIGAPVDKSLEDDSRGSRHLKRVDGDTEHPYRT